MTKEEILSVIIENLKLNVDDLEEVKIDPNRSMLDYGATSLDIVEIVSGSMRQLGIRIPRTALASAKNINDLADIFTAAQSK